MGLRTIIVEDEPLSRIYLGNLLQQFCCEVEVVDKVGTVDDAVAAIIKHDPELLFLDIELHAGTGFDVLKRLANSRFNVIFTTALDHHAINIIKMSGVDYLQKPIDIDELQSAIANVKNCRDQVNPVKHLLATLANDHTPTHIKLCIENVSEYLSVSDIIRVESVEMKSEFVLITGEKKLVSKPIKEYDSMLSDHGFCRIHLNHLINLNKIKKLLPHNNSIEMHDGAVIPVADKKKDEVFERCEKGFVAN